MPSALTHAGLFLIHIVFNFVLFVLLLRIVLQWLRVDFYNPLSQWLVRLTNPCLQPLRNVLRYRGRLDLAALIMAIAVELLKLVLLAKLQTGILPAIPGILILTSAELLQQLINLWFFALLLVVLASWINPRSHNPAMLVLYQITEPLLQPVRRILPNLGVLDLSPLIVIVGLKLLEILLVQPLLSLGFANL